MFLHLNYKAEFLTGRKLEAEIDFSKGMTAVYGRNESGKSFMLEMLRFMLFGSAALRGSADTYDFLKGDCGFMIRGETYVVERTLKKATLSRGGETLATGVTGVNEKIVGLMGFGIQVFDVACAATQNNLLSLTQMRPTERKRMVDTTIGVGMLEAVAKWAREEATLAGRNIAQMKSTLRTPVAPSQPENYQPSALLQVEITEAQALKTELDRIDGFLRSEGPGRPNKPTCSVPIPASALKPMADARKQTRADLAALKAYLAKLPVAPAWSEDDLARMELENEAYHRYLEACEFVRKNPAPQMDVHRVEQGLTDWKAWNDYQSALTTRKNAERVLSEITTQCPKCDHEWSHDEQTRNSLLAIVSANLVPVEKPEISLADLNKAKDFYARWSYEAYAAQAHASEAEAEKPELNLAQINKARLDLSLSVQRKDTEEAIAVIEQGLKGDTIEEQYEKRLRFEQELEAYERILTQAMEHDKRRAESVARKAEIGDVGQKVADLMMKQRASILWESEADRFQKDVDAYDRALGHINRVQEEEDQYRAIAAAMTLLRTRIKQYLLPSLNRVASALLARATSGERNSIVVDEEFNIVVDNQPVETLSGSAQACVNLALRIALGQVLVKNVFSVFLADEIDGSMDSVRARETSETLRNLSKSVSQILVISHKSIEADHEIVFGDPNATNEPGSDPTGD